MGRSNARLVAPAVVGALLLGTGCRTAATGAAPPDTTRVSEVSAARRAAVAAPTADGDPASGFARPDPERTAGIAVLGEPEDDVRLRLRLPVAFGVTDVDVRRDLGLELESSTTVSFVPTLEAPLVLDRRWTLVPYAGLGAAWQDEDELSAGEDPWVWLARGGLRAHYWRPFGERYAFLTKGELRYDRVLGEGRGSGRDLGSIDAAVEVRRVFGEPDLRTHLQPGLYLQALHFFQDDDVRVGGVTPQAIEDQLELGVSLGTSEPASIGWLPLPRVFIGAFVGEEQRGVRIRVGQL